jgi:hypothetical protein
MTSACVREVVLKVPFVFLEIPGRRMTSIGWLCRKPRFECREGSDLGRSGKPFELVQNSRVMGTGGEQQPGQHGIEHRWIGGRDRNQQLQEGNTLGIGERTIREQLA